MDGPVVGGARAVRSRPAWPAPDRRCQRRSFAHAKTAIGHSIEQSACPILASRSPFVVLYESPGIVNSPHNGEWAPQIPGLPPLPCAIASCGIAIRGRAVSLYDQVQLMFQQGIATVRRVNRSLRLGDEVDRRAKSDHRVCPRRRHIRRTCCCIRCEREHDRACPTPHAAAGMDVPNRLRCVPGMRRAHHQ